MPSRAETLRRAAQLRRGSAVVALAALLLTSAEARVGAQERGAAASGPGEVRAVSYHGLRLLVPASWPVVHLGADSSGCLRLDRPAVYVGHVGSQRDCPAHLVGGSPALHLEPLDRLALHAGEPDLTMPPGGDLRSVRLPSRGPATVAVEAAGVLVTAYYGDAVAADALQQTVAGGAVLAGARQSLVTDVPAAEPAGGAGVSAPGDLRGKGFDACTAPSHALMNAWRHSSEYASVGVYIGGVSRGCGQPNLTPHWVATQARNGWRLVPTYVGLQAPCTSFTHRISYNPATARAQGRAEAVDAVVQARALGLVAPSTIYSDMEGYDNTLPKCVASVLGYLSGWTYTLQRNGYMSGVYSSASSGMRDLSTSYDDPAYLRPDDIWIAWWNGLADVDGGSYVPDSQWRHHQRVHQYAGNVTETHGGYPLQIDRNYLDVSASVKPPRGCPANLDFAAYPMLRVGSHGDAVVAVQCLLARAGFDPGAATGRFEWRTASAARAFKASVGLSSDDSAIRRWAWTALASNGATEFLKRGAHGSRVRKVQRALTARLARTVDISGSFDGGTERAVKDYQAAVHLTRTGTVGPVTWTALHAGR